MMQVNMGLTQNNLSFSGYRNDVFDPDNRERFLNGDHAVLELDPVGVLDFLDFIEINDQWVNVSINECSVVPDKNEESMMSFLNENSSLAIPVRFTAVDSILQRAGLNCPLLQRTEPCAKAGVLSPEERTSWITKGLSLNKANAKVLIREGKISAMLSAGYGIMPLKNMYLTLVDILEEEHPDRKLIGGVVSHAYSIINIDLGSSPGIDSLVCELKRISPSFITEKVSVIAQLQTSDVGLSCATIHLTIKSGSDEFRIGKSMKLKHADSNVEKFKEEVKKLGSLVQEAEDVIEELGNTPIKHVVGCVRQIQMKKSFIPKKILDDMISDFRRRFPADGTAMDVYLLVNEIMDRVKTQNQNSDLASYVTLSEQCAQLMYLPFQEYDYPEMG